MALGSSSSSRPPFPADSFLLGIAALIGLASGLAVVGFRYLIGYFRHLLDSDVLESFFPWGTWTVALLPALGGLLVGLLLWYCPLPATGISGVLRTATQGEPIPWQRIPFKLLAASISLGSGASLGPEGPSVEMGGMISALVPRWLHASNERIALLVGAGAAAGMAAGFNAPIAGVFLALELVLASSFSTATVSVVVLAAVVSSLVAQVGLGAQPAFMLPAYTHPAFVLPAYELRSLVELPFYLGLGFLASLVSVALTGSLRWSSLLFQGQIPGLRALGQIPNLFKPVLGGLWIGILGLGLPLGLGVGYETIESFLQNVPFTLSALGLLLFGKLIMTGISLGSGLVGGIFAPSLFCGAVLGTAYGKLLALWLPDSFPLAPPAAYAMVGMAAVLAGTVRAPLTAILLLFEMTRDYRIVLPLMAAVGLSIWISERIPLPSAYPSARADQPLAGVSVAEVMVQPPLLLPGDITLLTAARQMLQGRSHCALILDESHHLAGILTLQDLERVAASGQNLAAQLAQQACTSEVLTTFPDEPLAQAAQQMLPRGLKQLPVVSREDPGRVVGLLQWEQVTLAQSTAITRQAIQQNPPAIVPAPEQS